MTQVLHRLALWLWYLLPANPILVRVVTVASRRPRHLWLRTGYLGALLGVVSVSLLYAISGQNASLAELAKGASTTFQHASLAQLALMCLLAPAFTASAITQERDAQTFNILLSTPLSSAQIVFGSLISRLYFVLMLLIAGLPIFLMTMVYGGVTAPQILESFALSGATAILTGALAIFVAMMGVGTRRTIFSFYLLIVIYLLSGHLLGKWPPTWVELSPANIDGVKMSWLTALHPFLSLEVALNRVSAPPYGQLVGYSTLSRYALAYPSAAYVAWTTVLALGLTIFSIVFVRRGAKTGERTFLMAVGERLYGARLGQFTRPPRTVWHNPVAWREAKTRTTGRGLLRLALIVGGVVGPMILLIYYLRGAISAGTASNWLSALVIIQFALALIVATNTAATSITKEKESTTMDLLLTTPLTSRYILRGKLRGLVSFVLPLLAGPVAVLLLFGLHGAWQGDAQRVVWPETAFEIGALMLVYTSGACVVGLWRSLNSKTSVAAVMYSLGFLIAVCGVFSVMGFAIVDGSGPEFGAFLAPFTPFTAIRYLLNPAGLFATAKDFAENGQAARTAALIGSALAIAMWGFIVWRAYAALVRGFDMTLRKQSAV